MQCMILFPGRDGRLPNAEDMRKAGFVLSAALGPVRPEGHDAGAGVALAAEEHPAYSGPPGAESPSGTGTPTG